MLPESVEGWESLTKEELKALDPSADDVRIAMRDHFGIGSKCYFITKAQSIDFILNPDRRPAIMEAVNQKYDERQARQLQLRTGGKLPDRVAEAAEGRSYRFIDATRPVGGFTDPFSGRSGRIAYNIEDVADGSQFPIQKQTAQLLVDFGQLIDFDPTAKYQKKSPAHEAGFPTMADVLAGEAEVSDDLKKALTDKPSVPAPKPTMPESSTEVESTLDDILNALPG